MKLIPAGLSRNIAKQVLLTKKNSPHIFFVGGVVGVVAAGVMACKATLKLDKELDEIQREVDDYKQRKELALDRPNSEEVIYRGASQVLVHTTVRMAKLYGPSVVVGSISIAALTGSHVQLTRRNTALSASLAGLMKIFDDYRTRIQDELGEEKELQLYRCMEDNEIEIDGKKTKELTPGPVSQWSQYARFFDEGSRCWEKDAGMNRVWVKCQQDFANHKLKANGFVMLNDVYDSLGIERSSIGQIVGWVWNEGTGDDVIDFGLDDPASERFMRGQEPRILLDFNVDGVVYELIDKKNGEIS